MSAWDAPGKGLAPGLKVTNLGRRPEPPGVNRPKGDFNLSGLTEFAEKYHIKNGHFTALGSINKVSSVGRTLTRNWPE